MMIIQPSYRVLGGGASLSKGYVLGGFTGSTAASAIDVTDFVSETINVIGSTLQQSRRSCAGVNSSVVGYTAGDINNLTSVEGLTFSNETTYTTSASLVPGRGGVSGFNSTLVGLFAGGSDATTHDTINGLTFATDTNTSTSAVLSISRTSPVANNSTTTGYIYGGQDGTTYFSVIDTFVFASEAVGTSATTLNFGTSKLSSANSQTHGYVAYGESVIFGHPAVIGTIYKFEFATETISSAASSPQVSKGGCGTNSTTKAYFYGGEDGSLFFDSAESLEFTTDTLLTLSSTLSQPRAYSSSFQSGGVI